MSDSGRISDELTQKSDDELAEWHAGWRTDTAWHILAEKEWERRIALRLLQAQHDYNTELAAIGRKAAIVAAGLGVAGTLAGVLLGWML